MNRAIPVTWPVGVASLSKVGRFLMDIILHVGAHRTGTTTFQHYMRDHAEDLSAQSIGFWGPGRTRKSIFPGLLRLRASAKDVARAEGRVQMHLARAKASGVKRLLVSDENMIGTSRECLRKASLYPGIGDRMARLSSAFGDRIARVILTIRAQDLWWASAAAYTVARGHPAPTGVRTDQIAHATRTWRDVITDLACAVPQAELVVVPFEQYVGRPGLLLTAAMPCDAPLDGQARWLNRSPDARDLRALMADQGADPAQIPDAATRWQPFAPEQTAILRENYADDLLWLNAGADGLATLTEDPTRQRAGTSPPAGHMTRGHQDDIRHGQDPGHMAQSG